LIKDRLDKFLFILIKLGLQQCASRDTIQIQI
jgi:hypothetical protein